MMGGYEYPFLKHPRFSYCRKTISPADSVVVANFVLFFFFNHVRVIMLGVLNFLNVKYCVYLS